MFFREKGADGTKRLPLLPLRELVVFPHAAVSFVVGRERSISALNEAMRGDKHIFLVMQREATTRDPAAEDLHTVGTLATVVQVMRLPDATVKVLVEGVQRSRIERFVPHDDHFVVEVSDLPDPSRPTPELAAQVAQAREAFEEYAKLNKAISPEALSLVLPIQEAARFTDTVVRYLPLKTEQRQAMLEQAASHERLDALIKLLQSEIDILQVERKIKTRVKKQMERSQQEYYLTEQMQAIQKELGEKDEFRTEAQELEGRAAQLELTAEARDRVDRELRKLKMMSPMSAEAAVVRNYLDVLLAMPWGVHTEDQLDLAAARAVLDADHFGLGQVKRRIVEYLAVVALTGKLSGPILCLVGPPGVGKTSLARSIARATGRKFVRVALGGVRDEAEIRGHRRTYIGALPGRILQGLRKAESSNPVFLLDEIDKLSSDFRGDPASALLEVLDPEQNSTFNDHYLDLDFDLSKVMFICTANDLRGVPSPLLDRMEVVKIAGYTEAEKLAIAKRYLIPKQLAANGLTDEQLRVDRTALQRIVREYTRESGVRNLERELAAVCRKAAVRVVTDGAKTRVRLRAGSVETVLGVPKRRVDRIGERDLVGFVNGLAVNATGGSMVPIEAAVVRGTGKTQLTGSLGSVFQESAQSAVTYMRIRSAELGLKPEFWAEIDLHVHVPEIWGVDGPSAGIGLATAVVSAVCNVPVRRDVAMTGEITLHGMVRPIGGLKEKLLAAAAANIKRVLIPRDNVRDLRDVPASVRESLVIVPVDTMDEVLVQALAADPTDIFRTREAGGELPADAPAQTIETALPNA